LKPMKVKRIMSRAGISTVSWASRTSLDSM
jgi:hypothetical protein